MNTHRSVWERAALAIVLLSLAGCQLNSTLTSDEWTWLWGTVPFLLFAVGGFSYAYYRRRRQLDSWDLRESPEEPSYLPIVVRIWSAAAAFGVAFAIYNVLLQGMDPRQKLVNIGLWLLGTLIGAALALYLGPRMAEPPKLITIRSLPPDSGRS